MSVRATKDISILYKEKKLSAGTCGTVIEHCREGITDADNFTRVLSVKWGEIVWDHSEASMSKSYFVINEH